LKSFFNKNKIYLLKKREENKKKKIRKKKKKKKKEGVVGETFGFPTYKD